MAAVRRVLRLHATPSDDDPALREYNAYLAELANKDKEHKTP